jgi:hypothetical protein
MQVQTPRKQDVIRRVLAYRAEQAERHGSGRPQHPSPGYRPETLDVLFRWWLVSVAVGERPVPVPEATCSFGSGPANWSSDSR